MRIKVQISFILFAIIISITSITAKDKKTQITDPEFTNYLKAFKVAYQSGNTDTVYKYVFFPLVVDRQDINHLVGPKDFGKDEYEITNLLMKSPYKEAIQKMEPKKFTVLTKDKDIGFIDQDNRMDLIAYLMKGEKIYSITLNKDFPQLSLYFAKFLGQYRLIAVSQYYGE